MKQSPYYTDLEYRQALIYEVLDEGGWYHSWHLDINTDYEKICEIAQRKICEYTAKIEKARRLIELLTPLIIKEKKENETS